MVGSALLWPVDAGRARALGGQMPEPNKSPRRPSKRIGCAIYTRKSTDEGLEQAFNSL